jgi:large subunit ribosomal protein L29
MKAKELRGLSPEELKKRLDESYQELFNLRFRATLRQLTNYNELCQVRRNIARIKTIMQERELSKRQGI